MSTKMNKRIKNKRQRKNNQRAPLVALNETQKFYMDCLRTSDQVFAIGSAGTGKTYIASRHAVSALTAGAFTKVVIARPTASEDRHKLGFLPGTVEEKMAPWLVPLSDAMKEEIGVDAFKRLTKSEAITFLPFEYMRGRSIQNSVLILDEAQNCSLSDFRLLLTRIGENTQVIVCGDTDQIDIRDSGLETVIEMIDEDDRISADIVDFSPEDVVRSKIAQEWVNAFSTE